MERTARLKQMMRSVLGDRISTSIHAVWFRWLLRRAKSLEAEVHLIPKLVQKGDVVVDIGANGADWTWPLSRQVGPEGYVYAFEADPYYAEVTRKLIALLRLRNVVFFPFGLSDVSESSRLLVTTPDNIRVSGRGRVVRRMGSGDDQIHRTVEVKLEPLDSMVASYPDLASVRLIKCDVEGFELMVFRGASEILAKARPMVITEVGAARKHGYQDADLWRFFSDRDYDCYVVDSDGDSLRPSSSPEDGPPCARPNRIMIPKESELDPRLKISGASEEG